MQRKVMISCAVTGSADTPGKNPAVPVTPQQIAQSSIERLSGIVDLYRLDIGAYPTTDQGLASLNAAPGGVAGWNGPYLKDPEGIRDPWGRVFVYRSPGQRAGRAYDIVSLGADGKEGGTGEDADLINR